MAAHSEKRLIELLHQTGAILDGHFVLSSGKHAARYIQCAKLLQHPRLAQRVCRLLAKKAKGLGPIDAVIGPALGGIVVSYELARAMGVRSLFTERQDGEMTLRRGFRIDKGERVLIAEDVITTGGSSLEVAEVVTASGGKVVGIACIVDRRPEEIELPFPLVSGVKLVIEIYEPTQCLLCREGVPLIKPGSRV